MLTKEQILNADDLKRVKVDVPEWGGDVYVRTMTGAERDSFEQEVVKQKGVDLVNIRARLASLTLTDKGGKLLFGTDDVIELGGKSALVLDRIFTVAQKLNGIGADDVEDMAKNSKSSRSGDSTSD